MNTNKQFIHYFTMNKKIAATPKNHRQLFYFSYHKIITPAIFLTKQIISVPYFHLTYLCSLVLLRFLSFYINADLHSRKHDTFTS